MVEINKQFTFSQNVVLHIKTIHDFDLIIHGIPFNDYCDEIYGIETVLKHVEFKLSFNSYFIQGKACGEEVGFYNELEDVPENVLGALKQEIETEILFRHERINALKNLQLLQQVLEVSYTYEDWISKLNTVK